MDLTTLTYVVLTLVTLVVAFRLAAPSLYRKAKYNIKIAITLVWTVYVSTLTWLYGIRQERADGKADPKKVMKYCSGLFKPIFRFLKLTFEIDIPDSIDMNASYVIILNHQHALDAYLLNQLLPPLNFPRVVMKEELRGTGPIGKSFEKMDSVFLKRGTKAVAMGSLIEATRQVKKDGDRIVLFPEGTRHMGETLLPFKLGAFHAAIAAGIPLLPVVISSYKKLPMDWQVDLSVDSTIKLRVLQPVPTEGYEDDEVAQLAEKCRQIMSETFAKM